MSDIRPALLERLKSIDAELLALTRRREQLTALRETTAALLEQENRLVHGGAILRGEGSLTADATVIHPANGASLSDHLLQALASGPKTLEQLKEIGAHWFPADSNKLPGRAINFALVGLQKGRHVQRLENGAWKLISGEDRR
jgi:hypothetical protein